jgi:hypothetical protein
MPGEFIALCGCRIIDLERTEDNKIRAVLECPVQTEAEELGHRTGAVKKLLQVTRSVPGEVLAEQK